MTSNPQLPTSSKKKAKAKKKKADPFWPIVIILSILAFTGSFWFFYMLTSKINTRNFPTTDTPKLMVTPSAETSLEGASMQVGNQQSTSQTPTASSQTLISAAPAVSTAPATSAQTSSLPSAAASAVLATSTPRATPSPLAMTTPATGARSLFRVQVGSYTSRDEAQQIASQLADKSYPATVIEEAGRFRVQIGAYDSQESALALAEEVTNQGYEVVVRKANP